MGIVQDEEATDISYEELRVEQPGSTDSAREDHKENHAASAAVILIGSVLGVFLRHCMQEPSEYSYYSYLFPNFVGSAVAAFLKKNGDRFWYSSAVAGLAVGMCGSLTTFSSWQKAAGQLAGPVHPDDTFHTVYLWTQIQMTGLAVGVSGYDVGWFLGGLFDEFSPRCEVKSVPGRHTIKKRMKISFDVLSIVISLCVGGVLVYLTVADTTTLKVALCTGPVASWGRWVLAKNLNGKFQSFPLGTFVANMVASCLLALCVVLGLDVVGKGALCTFIVGFGNGFCGSLSTVSTFVTEIRMLPRGHHSAIYAVCSMLCSQVIFLSIIGLYRLNTNMSKYHAETSCKFH